MAMQTGNELLKDEDKRIRRLKISADLLVHYLMTHPTTHCEAERLIEGVRRLAQTLFPGKDHVFDLIYMPRFRRALRDAGLLVESPKLRVLHGGKP
jgi:hypothetical protein